MKTCNPEGRDCIANKSSSTFNCSVAFDVQWVENIEEDVEEEDEVGNKFSGLLTGFSIISGFEIIFFLFRLTNFKFNFIIGNFLYFRLIGSFRIRRADVVAATKGSHQKKNSGFF